MSEIAETKTVKKPTEEKKILTENEDKPGNTKAMEVVLLDSDDDCVAETKAENNTEKEENKVIEKEKVQEVSINDSDSSIEEMEETKSKKRLVIVWQCLNPECTIAKKESLSTADHYTLSYYGMEFDPKKKRKVCRSCHQTVKDQQKLLVDKLHKKESMFSEKLPVPKEMVLLEDSDEEQETDSSGDSEFEIDASSICTDSDSSDGLGGTVEERLERIIEKSMEKLGFDFQVTAATKDLSGRLDAMKDDFDSTDQMFKDLETEVDGLRKELYRDHEPQITELPPVDLNKVDHLNESKTTAARTPSVGKVSATKSVTQIPRNNSEISIISKPLPPLPPQGVLEKPALVVGQEAFAMRQNILQVWRAGTVEEVINKNSEDVQYKLRFEGFHAGKKSFQSKVLPPTQLAFTSPASVRLPVGTRCIGLFKEQQELPGAYYSGIVAEPPKVINKNRYLVFFDDGYASYIPHQDIRVVCKSSANVWDDIHPNSKDFIKKYLDQYPERPMVKLTTGQVVKTEWDGKWWITRVLQVDASLVRLVFDADKRTEWIYRGSTRLGPLFTEMEQQKLRRQQASAPTQEGASFTRRQTMPAKRKNAPYIEYKRDGADPDTAEASEPPPSVSAESDEAAPKRAVARKSTASRKQEHLQTNTTKWEYEGTISSVDVKPIAKESFKSHVCTIKCLSDSKFQYREPEHKLINPLLIPMVLGWERQVSKHKLGGRRKVFYVAPCGRRLRSLDDVHRYLRTTQSAMEIDFFNFDWWLHVFNEFKPTKEFCTIKDLSYGKENVPVSCVNSIDKNYPEYVEYSTVRLPQKNVVINSQPEFLNCCDCTDDCANKDKCACWQMTIQSTAADREKQIDQDVGYVHRRLPEIVLTGVYECNPRCQCSKTCLNKVVQHPMRCRLQVFKTEKRGWGIRTLHDIPQGSFICVYVGNLYTSEEANKQGQNFGDEYFAELDMIEVIERRKDGYESDVSDEGFEEDAHKSFDEKKKLLDHGFRFNSEENSTEEEESSDKDFQLKPHQSVSISDDSNDRSTRRKGMGQFDGAGDTDDGEEADIVHPSPTRRGGFSATVGIAGPKSFKPEKPPQKFISTRRQYGKGEDVYIMDAKSIGNIGRYLNHSCNPNVFVQNVFVDTHDLRFPWIAFFTSTFVRAGGELCWDYNYEVGSIPGKELYCSCGSEYCRGKLL